MFLAAFRNLIQETWVWDKYVKWNLVCFSMLVLDFNFPLMYDTLKAFQNRDAPRFDVRPSLRATDSHANPVNAN